MAPTFPKGKRLTMDFRVFLTEKWLREAARLLSIIHVLHRSIS